MKIKNLKYTLATFGFTSIILTGCGKGHLLEDTVLDKSFVATVDDETYLLRQKDSKDSILADAGSYKYEKRDTEGHCHYQDVITGEYITDFEGCTNPIVRKVDEIKSNGNIYSKLTPDEMRKLTEDNLTAEDILNIVNRINQESEVKVKEKTIQ